MDQQFLPYSYYCAPVAPYASNTHLVALSTRPEDQYPLNAPPVNMFYDNNTYMLMSIPPDHISMMAEEDWLASCSPDYLVPAMMDHRHHHQSPPSFFNAMMDLSPTPLMLMNGATCGSNFMPPSPPLSIMSSEFLETTTSTILPLSPPSVALSINTTNHSKKASARTPYKCMLCDKYFTRPYNLKSHMRTHTNERSFVCSDKTCSWKFARPHDLKRHELLHSGKKPHACHVCDKRFARRDALRRHWKVDRACGDVVKETLDCQ